MKVIVDRIEENFIVVEIEKGKTVDIPKELIPDAQEGDVISIQIEKEETNHRKKMMEHLMNSVFESDE